MHGVEIIEMQIRASMLPKVADCELNAAAGQWPDLFAEAGLELRPRRDNIGAVVGKAWHKAAQVVDEARMAGGHVLLPEAEAVAIDALRAGVKEAASLIWDEQLTPRMDVAEKQLRRIVMTWWAEVAHTYMPAAVELKLLANAGIVPIDSQRHIKFTLKGEIDLYTTTHYIRDRKSGKIQPRPQAQLGAYSLLARAKGMQVDGLGQDFLQRAPYTQPQPDPVSETFDVYKCERAAEKEIARIKTDLTDFMRTGDPQCFTANPITRMCGAKWCSAWGTGACSMWKGKE